jgi:hypothetical protein
VIWLDKMIQPQGDPWLLRWDLGKTDFMEPDLPPAFLYYNPWPEEKRVTVVIANKQNQVYDLMRNKPLQTHAGTVELKLYPLEAQVIEIRT